jgi:hypothetical protein
MSLLTDVMALCNIPNLTTKSHDLAVHMAMDALLYGPDIDALSTGLIQGPIVPQHCHFFGLRNLNAPTTFLFSKILCVDTGAARARREVAQDLCQRTI